MSEQRYGILVYDRGDVRISRMWNNLDRIDAETIFSKWEPMDPVGRRQHPIPALGIVPVSSENKEDSYCESGITIDMECQSSENLLCKILEMT